MATAPVEACPLCIEPFNRSDRTPIPCEFGDCNWTACKGCTRQYLLGTTLDPHCMNCRKAWSQAFLVRHLNHSWVAKDYRAHHRELLVDREFSKLPETMEAAERVRRCRDEEKKCDVLRDKILVLEQEKRKLQEQQALHYRRMRQIKDGSNTKPQDKRKFILACPNPDCRGYLSTAYKCEICELHTCSKCLDLIGHSKHDEHECNPDSVKSADLIRKDTKPCPTCGERIFKISGCDQMWCPPCGTAFSWRTGAIDSGHVHNPHFYQAQRALNGGAIPRNPGDVLCGGLIPYYSLRQRILRRLTDDITRKSITALHQSVNHMTNATLTDARNRVRELGQTENLRVSYILGEKTKEEVASTICRQDRLRQKYTELLHVYELLSVVGIELFTNLANSLAEGDLLLQEVIDASTQYHGLRVMCNEQLQQISVTYSQSVPQWEPDWSMRRHKFTAKELRDLHAPTPTPEPKAKKPIVTCRECKCVIKEKDIHRKFPEVHAKCLKCTRCGGKCKEKGGIRGIMVWGEKRQALCRQCLHANPPTYTEID